MRYVFLILALATTTFTTSRVHAYDYILGWWDSDSSSYVKSGVYPVDEYMPSAFGFGDFVSLNNPNGMVVQGLNFLVNSYSSTFHTTPAATFALRFYSVNPDGSGSYQGAGASLGDEIATHWFYNHPMTPYSFGASSGLFQFEGFSVSVPQHFALMVYNQDTYTTSFRVLTTTKQQAQWNASQGELVAFSDSSRYLTSAQGYIAGRNIQMTLAGVPEPSTYALLLMTGAGALWLARKKRSKFPKNN